MRGAIPINLASSPFRRDRPFVVAALAGCALLGGLFAYLTSIGLVERSQRKELEASIEEVQSRLSKTQQEKSRLEETLRKPANAEAIDYSLFLNELILRKGISWTRIFGDLDAVIPHNVRLVSVRPQVNQTNQVLLDMTVASQTAEPVIEMLMRLEGSPVFGATAVATWQPPSQSEPLYRYRVNVNYAPKL